METCKNTNDKIAVKTMDPAKVFVKFRVLWLKYLDPN